ncbi:MAG: translesion error-prone DNA polymerase V autoproteolytic subunit [Cyanobacteria bacterium P01_F01_bin.3]
MPKKTLETITLTEQEIPTSNIEAIYRCLLEKGVALPLYDSAVSAGFPSPADDHLDRELDLNELLIEHPAATFFARAAGNSMEPAGIFDGDLLVVDRSLKPRDGRVVVAAVNGELTVKRVRHFGLKTFLDADNKAYQPIEITEFCEVVYWGVVTNVIHRMR